MKIDYRILWIEDDLSWYETTLELFKGILDDEGFVLQSDKKSNIEEIKEMLRNDGLQNFDMVLIDFTLKNSDTGDEIIRIIREQEIYTDILFYSTDREKIADSIRKQNLEGVFTADRQTIEEKFKKVFRITVKKVLEINTMRGLIIGETSNLDIEIENIIMQIIETRKIQENELKQLVESKVFALLKKRYEEFWSNYECFSSYFDKIEAIKKWEILRDLLKPLKEEQKEIATFLAENKTYQDEVIEIRNTFAHVKSEEKDGKTILVGKNGITYDEEKCTEIRKNLITHKKSINVLKSYFGIEFA